jgi:hypothetical protein
MKSLWAAYGRLWEASRCGAKRCAVDSKDLERILEAVCKMELALASVQSRAEAIAAAAKEAR